MSREAEKTSHFYRTATRDSDTSEHLLLSVAHTAATGLSPASSGFACRLAVACSVTGVGEAMMRAGLARARADALAADTETAGEAGALSDSASMVDAVCAREIRNRIEAGQPPRLPCPHRDCGVLAGRVSRSAAAMDGLQSARVVSGGAVGSTGGSWGASRSGDTASRDADVSRAGVGTVQSTIAQEDGRNSAEDCCEEEGLGQCAQRNSGHSLGADRECTWLS